MEAESTSRHNSYREASSIVPPDSKNKRVLSECTLKGDNDVHSYVTMVTCTSEIVVHRVSDRILTYFDLLTGYRDFHYIYYYFTCVVLVATLWTLS